MQVPLLDLKAQYRTLREEMQKTVLAVLEDQMFINGPQVNQLEKLIAEYTRCRCATAVSSGTDALLESLMALGVGPGDQVITTPYTFFATAGCIWRSGAKPVFVDIEPDTFNIDTRRIESVITPHTRALMPVHLFGQMADMDPIMALAQRHKLLVIEDAAQAIGATQNGLHAGSIGAVGCFSFFPSKNLGGLGDGGMITTQDPALDQKLKIYRDHGQNPRYYYHVIGGNFRLDTIQAAGLIVKLKHLEHWAQKRRDNAKFYDHHLAGVPGIRTPVIRPYNVSVFNQYVLRCEKRDALQEHLKQAGIGTAIYYPLSLHEQACFAPLGYRRGRFPHSEQAAAETLALPIYPELSEQQLDYVARKIREFYGK